MLKSKFGKFLAILLVVLLSGIITAGAALADELLADGDGLTPVTDGNELNFGNITTTGSYTKNVLLAIKRTTQGSPNIFKNSSTASVTTSVSSSFAAWITASGGSITLPGNWESLPLNTLTDGVLFAVTLNIPSGITSASNGTYTGKITYTATGTAANNSGITRSATIDFRFTLAIPAPSDTTPPVLTLPDNITAEATGPSGAIVTFTINAYDEVDGFITPTVNPASGSTFPLGATTVNVSATDAARNTATGSFTVTVVDTTAPEITVPADITAEATGPDGARVTFSASATDLVDGFVTVSYSHEPGSIFPLGETIVTVTATDNAGNTAEKSFTVTVVDTTAPEITVPADITAEATGPNGARVTFSASATDLVDGSVTVSYSHEPDSIFPLGETIVTVTATDNAGNTANKSFKVTVVDTTAPEITMPADITAEATGPDGARVTFSASATDLVDGSVTVSYSHEPGSIFPLGETTVTVTATDNAGNTANKSFKVTVVDTTPPSITVPATLTVIVGESSSVLPSPTVFDIVDPNPTITNDAPEFFGPGVTVVTWTATDNSGNKATATTTVTALYNFSGILQPINSNGTSVFKLGSTVPVKFQLFDAKGEYVTNAVARIYITQVSKTVFGTEDEAVSTSNATTGNLFRYDFTNNQYIFNLGTKSLSRGTWTISIQLNDGSLKTIQISLR